VKLAWDKSRQSERIGMGSATKRGNVMTTVTHIRSHADVDVLPAQATRPGFFSRVVTALHHSRELQAQREIERHRHLIEQARAYDARRQSR
jgi:hypothetical protein